MPDIPQGKTRIRVAYSGPKDAYEVYADKQSFTGDHTHYLSSDGWKEYKENQHSRPPFMELERRTAQELMDELWKAGVRPSNECGTVGEKDAIQSHLEDMRRIAFSELGMTQ